MSDFESFFDLIKFGSGVEIENEFKIQYLGLRDNNRWTLLHHACRYGRVGLVKILIDNRCDINASHKNGYQPIHFACMNGYLDIVKTLIDNKCNINASNENGYQPIHFACINGYVDIVKLLIDNKCNINASNKDGYSPIHLACKDSHIDIVKLLIDNKCNINSSNELGYQPIHFACMNGHADNAKILIDNKCNINAFNEWVYQPIYSACENRHFDIVKILIDNKCNINASSKSGSQPIHFACKNGNIDIVKLLIDNKCNINASNECGYQPIHRACKNGHVDIVKILINNKCNINASNELGYRPIHFACENGHVDIVKLLIDNKCDINALTKKGKSSFDIARQRGQKEIIDIIINNPADAIETIVKALNLKCTILCNHKFCRKTLNKQKLPKGELIGSGSFGKIFKYKISNREIVIKKTGTISEDNKNIERNINKFSSQIIHKNIVRYFGVLEKSGKLCIFMEYISKGSLKDLIDKLGRIEIIKVIQYSKQILLGLQFLHSKTIIHRDIKPENILLDHDETVKLTDFGLSKFLQKSFAESIKQAGTCCGTLNYLAPEIVSDDPYDYPADIWSTGATIIHMITGKMPYHNLRLPDIIFMIGTIKKIEFTPNPPISETMQSFINDLLTPDQLKRPSAEILLNHSIFENVL